jgi:hypothetical protein
MLPKRVIYSSGAEVDVPHGVLDHSGHDLLPIVQRKFDARQERKSSI